MGIWFSVVYIHGHNSHYFWEFGIWCSVIHRVIHTFWNSVLCGIYIEAIHTNLGVCYCVVHGVSHTLGNLVLVVRMEYRVIHSLGCLVAFIRFFCFRERWADSEGISSMVHGVIRTSGKSGTLVWYIQPSTISGIWCCVVHGVIQASGWEFSTIVVHWVMGKSQTTRS